MALIAFDRRDAAAFEATRHLGGEALDGWREAITRYLDPQPGMCLLDLGSGTGSWSQAFRAWWPATDVLAVEPSVAMRERAVIAGVRAGDAADIPVDDASVDAVWISTVIHHIPDLPVAAREIRRVLKPGAPVLIRSVFPGRHAGITLCHFWPEAVTALNDNYPTVAHRRGRVRHRGLHRRRARSDHADLRPVTVGGGHRAAPRGAHPAAADQR